MLPPTKLEDAFVEFSQNLPKHVPDGVLAVNLDLLSEIGLLDPLKIDQLDHSDELLHYFHVIENPDKVTLFNDLFAIWIVPKLVKNVASTLIFISRLKSPSKLHLELVFSTSGVYNTPKYILKTLEHFLKEVVDNEALISSIKPPHS
ncbi:hypothetical protein [Rhabdochlamydiaceae symbiont of Dictyostelium giganteum]|uniref:hypothetical protein n=1 Tax=Rhabdochlamydiaceae symbiont of Dictyostelium giganteum TaxID=3342349 RepID=UPI00384BAF7A